MHFSTATVLAAASFFSLATAVPPPSWDHRRSLPEPKEPSLKKKLEAAYGPLTDWKSTKLIDVYPGALVDGKPASADIILEWTPPDYIIPRNLDAAPTSPNPEAHDIAKRWTHSCDKSSSVWVWQSQLYSAKDTFCGEVQSSAVNGVYSNIREWYYDAPSNSWRHITNAANGNWATVWFWYRTNGGFVFDWNTCYNTLFELIWRCPGSNPDSAGGSIWGYHNGQADATIDTW